MNETDIEDFEFPEPDEYECRQEVEEIFDSPDSPFQELPNGLFYSHQEPDYLLNKSKSIFDKYKYEINSRLERYDNQQGNLGYIEIFKLRANPKGFLKTMPVCEEVRIKEYRELTNDDEIVSNLNNEDLKQLNAIIFAHYKVLKDQLMIRNIIL